MGTLVKMDACMQVSLFTLTVLVDEQVKEFKILFDLLQAIAHHMRMLMMIPKPPELLQQETQVAEVVNKYRAIPNIKKAKRVETLSLKLRKIIRLCNLKLKNHELKETYWNWLWQCGWQPDLLLRLRDLGALRFGSCPEDCQDLESYQVLEYNLKCAIDQNKQWLLHELPPMCLDTKDHKPSPHEDSTNFETWVFWEGWDHED